MSLLDTLKLVASKALVVAMFVAMSLVTTLVYMLVTKTPSAEFTRLFGLSLILGSVGTLFAKWSTSLGAWVAKQLKLSA
jgi:hypothetical protein